LEARLRAEVGETQADLRTNHDRPGPEVIASLGHDLPNVRVGGPARNVDFFTEEVLDNAAHVHGHRQRVARVETDPHASGIQIALHHLDAVAEAQPDL